MDTIKKIITIIIRIILILALIALFNLIMMPKYITENKDGRIIPEMYREKVSPDVLFIGSSVVYSGVVPAEMYKDYGYTSYVCATSSQTAWNSYWVLEEALNYYSPKLVVFDIGFLTVKEDYAEEVSNRKTYDYMRPTYEKYKGVSDAMAYGETVMSYALPVLRYHTRYTDLSLDDFKYSVYKPSVTYNGYIMNTLASTELPELLPMEQAEDVRLNTYNAQYLQNIITTCKENGIDLLLMKTPSYQSKWGPSFEEDIANVASANRLQYINFDAYSDIMGFDWMQDSPDSGRHLNLQGAQKFTYYLGNIIKDYYSVPDRRDDAKYKDIWDKKLDKYTEDMNKSINN